MEENKELPRVILAISDMKDFEKFLSSSLTHCVLMNLHINMLPSMVNETHRAGKTCFLHMELIHGLAGDEAGCEYACQNLQVDGVISTKGKVLEAARRNKKIAILRIFLVDSKSLEKGIALCNSVEPDYVELLPGLAYEILPRIRERIHSKCLFGGLIKSEADIRCCLEAGAVSVTVSDRKLAEAWTENTK